MAPVAGPVIVGLVVLAIVVAILVALVGLAALACLVQRLRPQAEARLDDVSNHVLRLAVGLSDQTQAEGHEARLGLIRAAHGALTEQQVRGHRLP